MPQVDVKEAYRIDAKPFVERPFYVETLDWDSGADRYSMLNVNSKYLPGDIIRSNPSLLSAMKIASLYRSDLVLNVSVGGTITHAGCILVGIMPPLPAAFNSSSHSYLINTILSGPHAFLYANEATSVNLPVPWYCNTDMATLDFDQDPSYITSIDSSAINGNYATLVALVLNPLTSSAGSSKTIRIVVEAIFKNLDILIPTPRYVTWVSESLGSLAKGLLDKGASFAKEVTGDAIDGIRSAITQWTGLHNPSNPFIQQRIITTERNFPNAVDSEQFFEKLDPYTTYNRIVKQPIFHTSADEMAMPHILSKRQMIGTVKVNVDDPVGKLLWVRPISPYQGGLSADKALISNNIELMHLLSRGWRGGLKIHLVSVMNNKQQFKIRVLKMYNPSVNVLGAYPQYRSIVNAPSHLMEFTQGAQEHIVDLPYLCRNTITPCARDSSFEALFHGLYYIYLAQPLVISDGAPLEVEFNVFISCADDFNYYSYSTERASVLGFDDFVPPVEGISRSVAVRHKVTQKVVVTPIANMVGVSKVYREVEVDQDGSTIDEFAIRWAVSTASIMDLNADLDLDVPLVIGDKLLLPPRERIRRSADDSITFQTESFPVGETSVSAAIRSWRKRTSVNISCTCMDVMSFDCKYVKESLTVMNEPQKQMDTDMVNTSVSDLSEVDRLVPNVDMRPYIRRMYKYIDQLESIPPYSIVTSEIPMSAVVGEDPLLRTISSSPASVISNMFYGKSAGFKVKLRITKYKYAGPLGNPTFSVNCRYLPPNLFFTAGTRTTLGCAYNAAADIVPGESQYGQYPLPYQTTPVTGNESEGSHLYEFMIPDVTYYKFMGSPAKLTTSAFPTEPLSTFDFGSLLITITNISEYDLTLQKEIYFGMSDETRLGFHCIAPLVALPTEGDKRITLYGGNINSNTDLPTVSRSPFLYKGGFI